MKKNINLITIMSLSLAIGACGDYKKDPVPDISEMRRDGKVEIQKGPNAARTVIREVVVEKTVEVIKEASTIDEKFIVITPDRQMTFNEGQKGQFKIRARSLVPGVAIKLAAQGLPDGAKIEKSASEQDVYILSWTPALYTIPSNDSMKAYTAKVTAEVTAARTPQELEKLKGLLREKEIDLFLFKNQEALSSLNVAGLSSVVDENTVTPFSVTVKVPGTDQKTPVKPRLTVTYDNVKSTAGNDFLELDGARYVDLAKTEPEFIGDATWKFSLTFDTKKYSVQPQLGRDGSILPQADGTRVRLNLKVYSPYGLSTPESLVQVKIRYAQKVEAPK